MDIDCDDGGAVGLVGVPQMSFLQSRRDEFTTSPRLSNRGEIGMRAGREKNIFATC